MSTTGADFSSSEPTSSARPSSSGSDNLPLPKLRPRKFRIGGTKLRSMKPCKRLPVFLDPDYTDAHPTKLPRVWYGIPFVRSRIIAYAKQKGIAEAIHPGPNTPPDAPIAYNFIPTLTNVMDSLQDKLRVRITLEEVWGVKGDYIFAFFSNHNLEDAPRTIQTKVEKLKEELGYDTRVEPRWYLDMDYEL